MIENISHITFVVKDLDRTTELYKELFEAKEINYIFKYGRNFMAISNRIEADCHKHWGF